ncbi:MAG: DsbA family protein [Planctomycetaceae bacterium]
MQITWAMGLAASIAVVGTVTNRASAADASTEKTNANGKVEARDTHQTESSRAPVEARKPPGRRLITISGNRTTLDVRQWPLLGRPEAKYVFVEMFDYTCPHCQATHHSIKGAMERYGDELAIIVLPVPLDGNCNSAAAESNSFHTDACEITRISIAVWRVQPKRFPHFHSWLFQSRRSAAEARSYAAQLVGAKALQDELAQPWAAKYIAKNVELYRRAGAGSVPKLLFPKSTLVGEVGSTATLCDIIQRELGPH